MKEITARVYGYTFCARSAVCLCQAQTITVPRCYVITPAINAMHRRQTKKKNKLKQHLQTTVNVVVIQSFCFTFQQLLDEKKTACKVGTNSYCAGTYSFTQFSTVYIQRRSSAIGPYIVIMVCMLIDTHVDERDGPWLRRARPDWSATHTHTRTVHTN